MVYARRAGNRELTFDFAEGLIKDNLLVVDRETGSIWSQLDARAVSGELKGTPLQIIPAMQTTFRHWRSLHPDTRVMTVPGNSGRPYYYRDRTQKGSSAGKPPLKHDVSTLGLGLVIGDQAAYFPLGELGKGKSPLQTRLGGRAVAIHFDLEAFSAWAIDEKGDLLPAVMAYREGWLSFYPRSQIYEKKQ